MKHPVEIGALLPGANGRLVTHRRAGVQRDQRHIAEDVLHLSTCHIIFNEGRQGFGVMPPAEGAKVVAELFEHDWRLGIAAVGEALNRESGCQVLVDTLAGAAALAGDDRFLGGGFTIFLLVCHQDFFLLVYASRRGLLGFISALARGNAHNHQ
ncbi:MAG: hypothetical protein WBD62_16490 [Anaerolineales bacterium]